MKTIINKIQVLCIETDKELRTVLTVLDSFVFIIPFLINSGKACNVFFFSADFFRKRFLLNELTSDYSSECSSEYDL